VLVVPASTAAFNSNAATSSSHPNRYLISNTTFTYAKTVLLDESTSVNEGILVRWQCHRSSTMSSDAGAPLHERDVCFVVTGFGPFRDVPSNPTTTIVQQLVEYLRRREDAAELNATSDSASRCSVRLSTVTRTRIIETSAQEARCVVDELYVAHTSSDSGSNADAAQYRPKPKTIIFLHLGVNYKGTAFQIEACAYNEANFRVPDERGDQPQGETIIVGRELGAEFFTPFDVPDLVSTIDDSPATGVEERRVLVSESRDPGRFVCNYTYCLSLDRCQRHNLRENNDKAWSIFLHVPPFDQIPEQAQLDFVARLMEQLLHQAGKYS
jgi:pyroglutamyl-peptidase